MDNTHYKNVKNYFSAKADSYDLVEKQLYWRLSDDLLKKFITKKIVKPLSSRNQLNVLDAGAGTGIWSIVLYDILYEKGIEGRFDLLDITPEMLHEANKKIEKLNIAENMKTHIQNIEDLSEYSDNFYDISISFYNVLSFVDVPEKALQGIYTKLKKDGIFASIVANKYHAYFFNILTNHIEKLDTIKKGSKVSFTNDMPYIHCFTPEEIKGLYTKAGFKDVEVIGFPNFIYPNMEETRVRGQSSQAKSILSDKKNYNKILDIEYGECFNKDIAARGNVLLVIGRK